MSMWCIFSSLILINKIFGRMFQFKPWSLGKSKLQLFIQLNSISIFFKVFFSSWIRFENVLDYFLVWALKKSFLQKNWHKNFYFKNTFPVCVLKRFHKLLLRTRKKKSSKKIPKTANERERRHFNIITVNLQPSINSWLFLSPAPRHAIDFFPPSRVCLGSKYRALVDSISFTHKHSRRDEDATTW